MVAPESLAPLLVIVALPAVALSEKTVEPPFASIGTSGLVLPPLLMIVALPAVAPSEKTVELAGKAPKKTKSHFAVVGDRLRLPRVIYDPGTLDNEYIPARVDSEGGRLGREGDRFDDCAIRSCQRSLRRGVERGRIAGVDGSARGRRPVGARVPVTVARVKQPDAIHGDRRGRRCNKQRQRDEERADRSGRERLEVSWRVGR